MKYFLPLIIAFSIFINPLNTLAGELILAGGCFWCLEHDLESLKGINFVQRDFDEKKIFYKSCRILEMKSEKIKIKKGYAFLKKELGEEGVVQRAAKEIINSII